MRNAIPRGRVALALLLLCAFVVARPPAVLVDRALAAASDGALRALAAQGTAWNGQATLASVAPDGRSVRPWLVLTWRTEVGEILRGGLGWRVMEGDRQVLRLRISFGGVEISGMRLEAPAGAVLGSLPHAYARAGWRGSLRISVAQWHCNWGGECHGETRLEWSGAGLDLLPRQHFGDYEMNVAGRGKGGLLRVRTLRGDFGVNGAGGWDLERRPHFNGEVRGTPEIITRLPNVMDGFVHPTGDPTRALIELR